MPRRLRPPRSWRWHAGTGSRLTTPRISSLRSAWAFPSRRRIRPCPRPRAGSACSAPERMRRGPAPDNRCVPGGVATLERVDRVQLVVRDRQAAARTFAAVLGGEPVGESESAYLGARRTVLALGESEVELCEPAGPGRAPAHLG